LSNFKRGGKRATFGRNVWKAKITTNMFFNVTFSEENEGRSKICLWAINNTHVVSNRYG